jgi:hypothetical protein
MSPDLTVNIFRDLDIQPERLAEASPDATLLLPPRGRGSRRRERHHVDHAVGLLLRLMGVQKRLRCEYISRLSSPDMETRMEVLASPKITSPSSPMKPLQHPRAQPSSLPRSRPPPPPSRKSRPSPHNAATPHLYVVRSDFTLRSHHLRLVLKKRLSCFDASELARGKKASKQRGVTSSLPSSPVPQNNTYVGSSRVVARQQI